MTCCADDTTFLGYVCKSSYAPKLKAGSWVKVRAKVTYEKLAMYRGVGPVLNAEHIEEAEPIEQMVYFNQYENVIGKRRATRKIILIFLVVL